MHAAASVPCLLDLAADGLRLETKNRITADETSQTTPPVPNCQKRPSTQHENIPYGAYPNEDGQTNLRQLNLTDLAT